MHSAIVAQANSSSKGSSDYSICGICASYWQRHIPLETLARIHEWYHGHSTSNTHWTIRNFSRTLWMGLYIHHCYWWNSYPYWYWILRWLHRTLIWSRREPRFEFCAKRKVSMFCTNNSKFKKSDKRVGVLDWSSIFSSRLLAHFG